MRANDISALVKEHGGVVKRRRAKVQSRLFWASLQLYATLIVLVCFDFDGRLGFLRRRASRVDQRGHPSCFARLARRFSRCSSACHFLISSYQFRIGQVCDYQDDKYQLMLPEDFDGEEKAEPRAKREVKKAQVKIKGNAKTTVKDVEEKSGEKSKSSLDHVTVNSAGKSSPRAKRETKKSQLNSNGSSNKAAEKEAENESESTVENVSSQAGSGSEQKSSSSKANSNDFFSLQLLLKQTGRRKNDVGKDGNGDHDRLVNEEKQRKEEEERETQAKWKLEADEMERKETTKANKLEADDVSSELEKEKARAERENEESERRRKEADEAEKKKMLAQEDAEEEESTDELVSIISRQNGEVAKLEDVSESADEPPTVAMGGTLPTVPMGATLPTVPMGATQATVPMDLLDTPVHGSHGMAVDLKPFAFPTVPDDALNTLLPETDPMEIEPAAKLVPSRKRKFEIALDDDGDDGQFFAIEKSLCSYRLDLVNAVLHAAKRSRKTQSPTPTPATTATSSSREATTTKSSSTPGHKRNGSNSSGSSGGKGVQSHFILTGSEWKGKCMGESVLLTINLRRGKIISGSLKWSNGAVSLFRGLVKGTTYAIIDPCHHGTCHLTRQGYIRGIRGRGWHLSPCNSKKLQRTERR